jgi:hypothetical protein
MESWRSLRVLPPGETIDPFSTLGVREDICRVGQMFSELLRLPAEFGKRELAKPTELSRRRDLREGRVRE